MARVTIIIEDDGDVVRLRTTFDRPLPNNKYDLTPAQAHGVNIIAVLEGIDNVDEAYNTFCKEKVDTIPVGDLPPLKLKNN